MTDVLTAPAPHEARRQARIASVFRAEWRKLTAQLVVRVLALVSALGPLAYVVVLKTQSGSPTDALLGAWAHSSGFAVVFVLLVFAGSWGFPVLAGLAVGDVFASEDRYGTWKMVLTRSRSRRDLFVGKVLAAVLVTELLVTLLAVSSVLSALLIVGHQPVVGLSGHVIEPGHAVVLVAAAWLWCMLPVLAFVALAVLFSVAASSGIAGVLGPILVGFAMQLLALVGGSTWAHLLLVGSAFDGWHAFITDHSSYHALIASAVVSVAWTVLALSAAWLIFRRREFSGVTGQRASWPRVLRAVTAGIAAVVVAAVACAWGPTGITAARLQKAITPTFSNLTVYQQTLLGRRVAPHAALQAFSTCQRHGNTKRGPGTDWTCTIEVLAPGPNGSGPDAVPVTYDLDVTSNGCYRAEGPPTFVGQSTLDVRGGRRVVNPVFLFYGCFDTL